MVIAVTGVTKENNAFLLVYKLIFRCNNDERVYYLKCKLFACYIDEITHLLIIYNLLSG